MQFICVILKYSQSNVKKNFFREASRESLSRKVLIPKFNFVPFSFEQRVSCKRSFQSGELALRESSIGSKQERLKRQSPRRSCEAARREDKIIGQ